MNDFVHVTLSTRRPRRSRRSAIRPRSSSAPWPSSWTRTRPSAAWTVIVVPACRPEPSSSCTEPRRRSPAHAIRLTSCGRSSSSDTRARAGTSSEARAIAFVEASGGASSASRRVVGSSASNASSPALGPRRRGVVEPSGSSDDGSEAGPAERWGWRAETGTERAATGAARATWVAKGRTTRVGACVGIRGEPVGGRTVARPERTVEELTTTGRPPRTRVASFFDFPLDPRKTAGSRPVRPLEADHPTRYRSERAGSITRGAVSAPRVRGRRRREEPSRI